MKGIFKKTFGNILIIKIKGEIMEEKRLSEFLKENGAYEAFIENCLKDRDTLQYVVDYSLSNISIFSGFIWTGASEGNDYWSKLFDKSCTLDLNYDMDEILYKEYERRNMKESSEQNPITKDIVENNAETTKQEFQIITLNGVDYYLVPKKEAPLLTLNDLRDIGLSDEDLIANGYSEEDLRKEPREKHLKRKFEQGNGQYEVLFKEKKSDKWEFCYRPNDLTWRKDCDYILIKKEHKEIIEAYLKDNTLKIQYRWHDEDWMLLDNFIENYDEDMQLRVSKKEFEPFTLNIEVKTLDEAKSLWNIFNLQYNTIYKALNSSYNVEFENRIDIYDYWNQIDDLLQELGEEPDGS